MAVRLKSWESPRRQGRNDKGKGGSARRRQLKKQQQMLRNKLKAQTKVNKAKEGRDVESLPSFLIFLLKTLSNPASLDVKRLPNR